MSGASLFDDTSSCVLHRQARGPVSGPGGASVRATVPECMPASVTLNAAMSATSQAVEGLTAVRRGVLHAGNWIGDAEWKL